jgi:hypothetical protein
MRDRAVVALEVVLERDLPVDRLPGDVRVVAEVSQVEAAADDGLGQAASTAADSLTIAPVCERAALTPAALTPPASRTTGLAASEVARAKARPSRKSSR